MKYLFIVQGEGRGHLTQAITLERMLERHGHEVVGIMVGKSKTRQLPEFFLKSVKAPVHQFLSINFLPSAANRKANMAKSVAYNIAMSPHYFRSMRIIKKAIQVSEADVVVNFYELLTGLTYMLHRIPVPQICIGHQYLFLHKGFTMPKKVFGGYVWLKFFTRITAIGANRYLALSFRQMQDSAGDKIKVVPPLLRSEVLETEPVKGDYIHGYMLNSGFAEDVMSWHKEHPEVQLRFFWDRNTETPVTRVDDTLCFHVLDDKEFLRQMAGCKAYASTAGFESVCEAMYLKKPILMVPSHIEQECNAFDAVKGGAGVSSDRFDLSLLLDFSEGFKPDEGFPQWARSAESVIITELEGRYKESDILENRLRRALEKEKSKKIEKKVQKNLED